MAKQLQRLQEYHMRAIDLRLQGYDYRQIAEELGRSYSAVHKWFTQQKLIQDELERRKKELAQRAMDRLISSADLAVDNILEILTNPEVPSSIRLNAAQDLLDRLGIKGADKLELKGSFDTNINKLDSILNQLKED
ncbi:MAG TPA: helix-turn-helix domain-containing protein [Thermoanaerobacterales bacterium]|nr:helix-turn-helix domain-containing protein [Thermoanaerobacterales bacterium]